MTVSATPTTAALPAISPELVSALTQATEALNALVAQLSGQSTTGGGAATAETGAQALAGGPGVGQTPGQTPGSGCGCGGASGAVAGAEDVGQAPPKGADAGPPAKGGKSKGGGGANAAPDAQGAQQAAPTQGGGSSSKGDQLVEEVKKLLGKKYVYGAEGPDAFDCSGLMLFVAKKLGINLPRTAQAQSRVGQAVDKNALQPGDLVYFATGSGPREISHIGMYIGGGKMIHAPNPRETVKVDDITRGYYADAYRGARRIV